MLLLYLKSNPIGDIMNKFNLSLFSFVVTALVASAAFATECLTDADCATGELCVAVASACAECPPCDGSGCVECPPCEPTIVSECLPAEPAVDCGTASSGSGGSGAEGSASEGSAADCGSGDPASTGSGSGEVVPVAGSGSGEDVAAAGSAEGSADAKSKSDDGCSTAGSLAGGLGILAGLATIMYMRRRKI